MNSVNVSGTVNLLKAAVDSHVQKFVYASSSSVYGDTETLPKKETMNSSPISPYGVSEESHRLRPTAKLCKGLRAEDGFFALFQRVWSKTRYGH